MGWQILKKPNSNDDLLSGNLAIHAALVETAGGPAIFYFDGVFGDVGARSFNVVNRTVDPPHGQAGFEMPGHHIMCCGHALLGDGRWLIGGGVVNQDITHEGPVHDSGERRCYLYHPLSSKWEQVKDLNFQPDSEDDPRGGGRWYPTLLTLANGEVFAVSGHPYIGKVIAPNVFDLSGADNSKFPGGMLSRHNNNTPERYSPAADAWTLLAAESTSFNDQGIDEYARVHLAPSGNVFFSTRAKGDKRFYNPYTGTYSGNDVPAGDAVYHGGSETTSVLLPILMGDLDDVWVLACGGVTPQRINIASGSPQWAGAGNRQQWTDPGIGGAATAPVRNHANAVILPTGQIFVTGGVGAANATFPQGTGIRRPELYTPPIDWDTGQYTAGDGIWETLPDAATVVRGYHGTALLMPDGAVFTCGSTDSAGGDAISDGVDANNNPTYASQSDFRIEIFQPWYFDPPNQGARPTVSNVPKSVCYASTMRFNTQANSIQRVLLVRCGSATHALDTDQRMVSLEFTKPNATTVEAIVPAQQTILPPGRYMLWVVDKQGRPGTWAPLVRICMQKPFFSVDIDKFAKAELDAQGGQATFSNAVYLAYDNFLPGEISTPVLQPIAWKDSGTPVPGIKATLGTTKYEAGIDNKDVAQRIVFPVHIEFENDTAFNSVPDDPGFREIELEATMGQFTTAVTLVLTKKLNPRMSDGDPSWLSIDLRAFSTRAGAPAFTAGVANPANLGAAYQYIQQLLSNYDTWPQDHPGEPHPFNALPTVQETSQLPIYPAIDGNAIFNFAVARVRFRAPVDTPTSTKVRVFFRLWTTGWTNMSYSTSAEFGSYPRSGNGAGATPLLGLYGGEVNTIPCFAEPRETTLTGQDDPTNLKTLLGIGADEAHTYFGCLIDSNQNVKLFPLEPDPGDAGPYSGELLTVQEVMRGLHQCLVAEIHYWPDDEIANGATPASSDNLAQRNLLFDEAPNPGGFATHLVHHTFELKASPVPFPPDTPLGYSPPQISLTSVAGTTATARQHPDELVIDWGNLPRDSHVVLYLPQVNVDEVLRFAARRQGPANLSKAGEHAIRCKVTDLSFIPIPRTQIPAIAGLLTVQLPPNLVKGQKFSMILRQVDGRKRRVIGTTQFDIHIKTEAEILPRLTRNLSVLKHIALSIPEDNRWYPVFGRYLSELGDRVRGMGADPDEIAPSAAGDGRPGREGFTGKVCELVYDCHGKFEGFVVEDCGKRRFFAACAGPLEEVARRACRRRSTVTVVPDPSDRTRPRRIIVHCCDERTPCKRCGADDDAAGRGPIGGGEPKPERPQPMVRPERDGSARPGSPRVPEG